MTNRLATVTSLRGFPETFKQLDFSNGGRYYDSSGQNFDNGEVHKIPKSWPDPTVDADDMTVGTPPLIFSL